MSYTTHFQVPRKLMQIVDQAEAERLVFNSLSAVSMIPPMALFDLIPMVRTAALSQIWERW